VSAGSAQVSASTSVPESCARQIPLRFFLARSREPVAGHREISDEWRVDGPSPVSHSPIPVTRPYSPRSASADGPRGRNPKAGHAESRGVGR
jgi:hypothetical protein